MTEVPPRVLSPGARPRRAGLTLLELMIVVVLITTMVGAAAISYSQVLEEQKQGKAKTELIQLAKGIEAYERHSGQAVKDTVTVAGQTRPFTLQELVWSQVMVEIPPDPWSRDYEVDTTSGYIRSFGSDGQPDTPDDLYHYFKPPFTVSKALFDNRSRVVRVQFSRELDPSTVTSSTVQLLGGANIEVSKVAVPMNNRFIAEIRLTGAPNVAGSEVKVLPVVKALDNRLLLEEKQIPVTNQ